MLKESAKREVKAPLYPPLSLPRPDRAPMNRDRRDASTSGGESKQGEVTPL